MNCKDCIKGILIICPECDKEIVICLEGEECAMIYDYWNKDFGCDGVE